MGCIHHSDRGSQYASETYRNVLANHGLVGSMGRRGKRVVLLIFELTFNL
jgi:putative transposase